MSRNTTKSKDLLTKKLYNLNYNIKETFEKCAPFLKAIIIGTVPIQSPLVRIKDGFELYSDKNGYRVVVISNSPLSFTPDKILFQTPHKNIYYEVAELSKLSEEELENIVSIAEKALEYTQKTLEYFERKFDAYWKRPEWEELKQLVTMELLKIEDG